MKAKTATLKDLEKASTSHKVWHKFYNWVVKTYGQDLHGPWQYMEGVNQKTGKKFKIKHRGFNDYELSKRLVGHEVIDKIERYIKRCCQEIKIIRCDDSLHAGSIILLIPHPKHGITVMFIPQCTGIQNQFFLYKQDYKQLVKELTKMEKVYIGVKY